MKRLTLLVLALAVAGCATPTGVDLTPSTFQCTSYVTQTGGVYDVCTY
jgi:hypothetical protein